MDKNNFWCLDFWIIGLVIFLICGMCKENVYDYIPTIILSLISLLIIITFTLCFVIMMNNEQSKELFKLQELEKIRQKMILENNSDKSQGVEKTLSTADRVQNFSLEINTCKNCKSNCIIETKNYKYELCKNIWILWRISNGKMYYM